MTESEWAQWREGWVAGFCWGLGLMACIWALLDWWWS